MGKQNSSAKGGWWKKDRNGSRGTPVDNSAYPLSAGHILILHFIRSLQNRKISIETFSNSIQARDNGIIKSTEINKCIFLTLSCTKLIIPELKSVRKSFKSVRSQVTMTKRRSNRQSWSTLLSSQKGPHTLLQHLVISNHLCFFS